MSAASARCNRAIIRCACGSKRAPETGKAVQLDFRNGLRTQKIWDAVLEIAKSGEWVQVP